MSKLTTCDSCKVPRESITYYRNKIVFELRKKKAIEEKKKYKEDRESKVKQAYNVMNSIENFYKDRIMMLKDKLADEKAERNRAK
jgi:hypothetical protein